MKFSPAPQGNLDGNMKFAIRRNSISPALNCIKVIEKRSLERLLWKFGIIKFMSYQKYRKTKNTCSYKRAALLLSLGAITVKGTRYWSRGHNRTLELRRGSCPWHSITKIFSHLRQYHIHMA